MSRLTIYLYVLLFSVLTTACIEDRSPGFDDEQHHEEQRPEELLEVPEEELVPPNEPQKDPPPPACQSEELFEAPLSDDRWRTFGDAEVRDGHLLLTQGERNQKSGLFLVGDPIVGGKFEISLRVSSGGCHQVGERCSSNLADGFALSVWDIDGDEVDYLFDRLGGGGHLGAAFRAGEPTHPGLNIEFDTYFNTISRHPFEDPTDGPHIAVFRDGRMASFHEAGEDDSTIWAAAPELADNHWHDVTVTVEPGRVTVIVDGEAVIDTQIEELNFDSGIIALTGSTGGLTAYHRVDEILIQGGPDQCE